MTTAWYWTTPRPMNAASDAQHLLDLFEYQHLPPHLQDVSKQLAEIAAYLTGLLGDGPELTAGLRKLLEAKDCFVRQAVIDTRKGA